MFERFTERGRQVVVLAQDEARLLKHNYIGTEHLLLGLVREDEGIAARALAAFELTIERVRAEVERIIGEGDEPTGSQIPFTPRAKKVLELSLREALQLGHNYIGTEHILLGLLREKEGVAARIMVALGVSDQMVRDRVIELLKVPGAAERGEEPSPPRRPEPELRWEYRVELRRGAEPSALQAELNALGADGWELVVVTPSNGDAQWVFKRARPRIRRPRGEAHGREAMRRPWEPSTTLPPIEPVSVEPGITLREFSLVLRTPIGHLITLLTEFERMKSADQPLSDDELGYLAATLRRELTIKRADPPSEP